MEIEDSNKSIQEQGKGAILLTDLMPSQNVLPQSNRRKSYLAYTLPGYSPSSREARARTWGQESWKNIICWLDL